MSQFRNLVFEGGGVKGIAYAGAIGVLEKKGILGDIKRAGGASAGAITAALLAAGASSNDIKDIVGHTSFRKFMDDSFGFLRDTKRLIHDYGWYKGDAFAQWMKKQIHALTGKPDLDFKGLRELAAKDPNRYRELTVVGTNLSTQMEQLFSADDSPDVPIWHAVRISMSIPLFFAAVKDHGNVLVDGGVTWNYPIGLFDERPFLDNKKAIKPIKHTKYDDDNVYNKETLGFRVDTLDEIQAEKDSWRTPPREINNFVDYAAALIGFILDTANKAHLHKDDWDRTVFIDSGGVSTTEFSLSDDQVRKLVKSGEDYATKYFKWFENPENAPINRVG